MIGAKRSRAGSRTNTPPAVTCTASIVATNSAPRTVSGTGDRPGPVAAERDQLQPDPGQQGQAWKHQGHTRPDAEIQRPGPPVRMPVPGVSQCDRLASERDDLVPHECSQAEDHQLPQTREHG